MKLAAIDIGSNAIRMQITHVVTYKGKNTFKKVEYIRFPLRLGHDVFLLGRISQASEEKFIKLMEAFKMLIDLYEVDDFYACATSAMRESENGLEIVKKVKQKHGLEINIIDGNLEAELINKSLQSLLDERSFLHIDVGGGSTEFNFYINREKQMSRSFKIGSVRSLEKRDNPDIWNEMKVWLEENIKKRHEKVLAIGTGGNIVKAYDYSGKKPGNSVSIKKLKEIKQYIEGFSLEDRISYLLLNPDRADVIVPALNIYITAMQWSHATSMIVPDIGLKDGLMHYLYERVVSKIEN
mgnify:CR=1 FL=1